MRASHVRERASWSGGRCQDRATRITRRLFLGRSNGKQKKNIEERNVFFDITIQPTCLRGLQNQYRRKGSRCASAPGNEIKTYTKLGTFGTRANNKKEKEQCVEDYVCLHCVTRISSFKAFAHASRPNEWRLHVSERKMNRSTYERCSKPARGASLTISFKQERKGRRGPNARWSSRVESSGAWNNGHGRMCMCTRAIYKAESETAVR